jgi:NADH-quinone oxidoreductase subunit N
VNPVLALIPEVVMLLAGLGLLAGGSVRPIWRRRLPWAGAAAVVVALGFELWLGALVGPLLGAGFVQDRFALFSKAMVLVALLVLLLAGDWEPEAALAGPGLALLAGLGAMIAASSTDLVGLWAGLELASFCSIAVVALAQRDQALRLLLAGGAAGALVALGFAFVYAVTGASTLAGIRGVLGVEPAGLPLTLAVLLMLAGLSIRGLLAPFHLSGLGVALEASPLGAGLLASIGAGTAALVAFKMLPALAGVGAGWAPYLLGAGTMAMAGGGLAALSARTPRELIAWLGTAQLGWVAAALATNIRARPTAGLFLLGAYMVAAATAPVALGAVAEGPGLTVLAGIGVRQPWRTFGLALALLSLAGTPPLAGFFGEFAVAGQLSRSGYLWLVALGALGGVLSTAAVLRALRPMLTLLPPDEARRLPTTVVSMAGSAAAGVACVLYGLMSLPISTLAFQAVKALGSR